MKLRRIIEQEVAAAIAANPVVSPYMQILDLNDGLIPDLRVLQVLESQLQKAMGETSRIVQQASKDAAVQGKGNRPVVDAGALERASRQLAWLQKLYQQTRAANELANGWRKR